MTAWLGLVTIAFIHNFVNLSLPTCLLNLTVKNLRLKLPMLLK